MKSIEKSLNFVMGLILLNNLYLLSGLTRIPNLFIIGTVLAVSIFYTVINWNVIKSVQLMNNWYTLFCVSFSIFLTIIDYFLFDSAIKINDLIRIVMYAFYFSWTFMLFDDMRLLIYHVKKLAIWSIFILVALGLFEYYQPYLWTFMLSDNVEKRTVGRIAGSLIDSNSYACSMIIYFLIFYNETINKRRIGEVFKLFLLFVLVVYFNDLSGSRQGLILIFLFLISLIIEKLSLENIKKIFVGLGFAFILFLIFNQQIFEYANQNPHSSLGRILSNSDYNATKSNIERQNSIYAGIIFLSENYFILGPGMLNFASRWSISTDTVEPHIGFLFLLVQYGLLAIVIFYVFYLSFVRSKKANLVVVFFSLFIHLSLQPNTVYYALTFLVLFYIDVKYFLKNETYHTTIITAK